MNVRYYIRHCFWGYFILGIFAFNGWYGHSWDELTNRQHVVAVYAVINALFYPFAYYLVERLGTQFFPVFWQKHYIDECGLKFFQVIIPLGCFLMTIPLFLIALFMGKSKKARQP